MKLVLEKFSKSFGPVSVIENLDLTVHSGETVSYTHLTLPTIQPV